MTDRRSGVVAGGKPGPTPPLAARGRAYQGARAEGVGEQVTEFEDVGVTWLVEGAWPVGDWVTELSKRIHDGPPR